MDLPLSYPAAAAALPRPGPLGRLLGIARLLACGLLLVLVPIGVLLATFIPGRIRGARPSLWVVTASCRILLWISGLRLVVDHEEALRDPRGFVFFNHVSYLDIPILLAVRPFRFLAAAGVRSIPVIGWVARAVRTVFVHRGDGQSREEARRDLAEAVRRSSTPIALAPEGGVQHGPTVQPFRHGAFEVAAETEAPVLLVVLDYEPRGYAAWLDGENLLAGYWRLVARTTPVVARIVALPPARLVESPVEDAARAESEIDTALAAIWGSRPRPQVR